MQVSLIFPPFVDPRAPYLALPSLAAHLREFGHQVGIVDANLELFDSVFSKQHLSTLRPCFRRIAFDYAVDNVDDAKRVLRCADTFYDYSRYIRSRNILDLVGRLLSEHFGGTVISFRNPALSGQTLDDALVRLRSGQSAYYTLLEPYLESRVLVQNPDLAGISITNSSQLQFGLQVSRYLRARGIRTVVGGATITLLRKAIWDRSEFADFADAYVIYEGEIPLERIVQNISAGRGDPFADVPGCIYRKNSGARAVPPHPARALDVGALPDFTDLVLSKYLSPHPVLPLLGAKGCSWGRCTFCSIPTTSGVGDRHRDRSAELVVEDLKALTARHGVRHFFFVDENVSAFKLEALSQQILKSNMPHVRWVAFSRFERGHTYERLHLFRTAGLRKLLMGLESASPRTLKAMRKGTSIGIIERNLTDLARTSLPVNLFLMTGFPGETDDDAKRTLQFVLDHLSDLLKTGFSASFSAFHLDPDSPLGRSGEVVDSSPEEQRARQRTAATLNTALAEAIAPFEMIGWEEHSLLYVDAAAAQISTTRQSTRVITRLAGDAMVGGVPLEPASWRYCAVSERLINCETGYVMYASAAVASLLDQIKRTTSIAAVSRPSDRRRLEFCVRLLLKHGFVRPISQQTAAGECGGPTGNARSGCSFRTSGKASERVRE